MNFRNCDYCKKETAHKRVIGIGTFIAVILTLGLWLLVIPFYPARCIHCGTAKWSAIDIKWPENQDRALGYSVIIGTLFLLMLVGYILNEHQKNKTAPNYAKKVNENVQQSKNEEIEQHIKSDNIQITSEQLLSEVKKILQDKSKLYPIGLLNSAETQLKNIKKEDSEYEEAQILLKNIKSKQEVIIKEQKEKYKKGEIKFRSEFTKYLERKYLEKGLDIYVTSIGPDKTTIKLKYILMSRPLLYKLLSETQFLDELKSHGFKKAIFTDGYRDTWDFDLTKK
jgi:hypothetical protein